MNVLRPLARWLGWLLAAAFALQLFFVARIALLAWVDPQSSAFQRSEFWRLASGDETLAWRQQWVPYDQISDALKRAVIASEDANFSRHHGFEWEAIDKAWKRNTQLERQRQTTAERDDEAKAPKKMFGGSTLTQQLAKNLLLSGERSYLRKGQELLLGVLLETFLTKRRILELYLNSVEWGQGVFGAEAAARHYFRNSAAELSAPQSARLAVMLPRPRHFERLPSSAYLARRTRIVMQRMALAEPP